MKEGEDRSRNWKEDGKESEGGFWVFRRNMKKYKKERVRSVRERKRGWNKKESRWEKGGLRERKT